MNVDQFTGSPVPMTICSVIKVMTMLNESLVLKVLAIPATSQSCDWTQLVAQCSGNLCCHLQTSLLASVLSSLFPSLPSSRHLLACWPGTYMFLLASPLIVRSWQEIASHRDHGVQLMAATWTAGIAVAKQRGCSL